MIYRILFFLCLMTNCACAQNSSLQYWKYTGKDKSKDIKIQVQNNMAFVPFLNIFIRNNLLDSMIMQGVIYDSLMEMHDKDSAKDLPQPIGLLVNGRALLYTGYAGFNDGDRIYSFYMSNTAEIIEHFVYEFYYVKDLGVVATFYKVPGYEHLFFDWDSYMLVKVLSKGKSLINNERLQKVKDQVLNACQCRIDQ